MSVLTQIATTAILTIALLLALLALFGFLATFDERLFPPLMVWVPALLFVISAGRGASTSKVLAVAVGVTIPVVLLFALSAISFGLAAPEVQPHLQTGRNLLLVGMVSFLGSLAAAWFGRFMWRKGGGGPPLPQAAGRDPTHLGEGQP